jgi:polyamine oxidase
MLDAIVVGAGMAGLTAARRLHDAGARLVVLEARDRAGGRVHTRHDLGPTPVELGGEFVHGHYARTWELLREHGIATVAMRESTAGEPDGASVHDEAWRTLPEPEPRETMTDYLARQGLRGESIPREIRYIDVDNEPLSRWNARALRHWLMPSRANGHEVYGEHDFRVPGGYDQVVDILADGLPITFEATVSGIDHTSPDRVSVTYRKHGRVHRAVAHTVVSTLPVGVLRHNDVTFTPPLPRAHREAIQAFGIVDVAKLVYVFPGPVLPDGVTVLEDDGNVPPAWLSGSHGVAARSETVLVGWAAGDSARRLLRVERDEALAIGLASLRRLLGRPDLQPARTLFHHWGADPFARGAYTFVPHAAPPTINDQLAQPVGGRLFLAGEATFAEDPATVNAAYISGERAANGVLATLGATPCHVPDS